MPDGTIYIAVIIAVIVLLALRYRASLKSCRQERMRKMRESWGKAPEREYAPGEMERISRMFALRAQDAPYIDDITWRDLDMDAVYKRMNICGSSLGDEYLYMTLRMPVRSQEPLKERDALAEYMSRSADERAQIMDCFYELGRKKNRAFADDMRLLESLPQIAIWPHILAMALLAAGIIAFAVRPRTGVFILIAVIAANIFTYYREKSRVSEYMGALGTAASLVKCGLAICGGKEHCGALSPCMTVIKESCHELGSIKSQAWIYADAGAGGDSIVRALVDYACMITHLDLLLLGRISRLLNDRMEALSALADAMGRLELAICTGNLREGAGIWCRPEFTDGLAISFSDMRHPLVSDCVPNSLSRGQRVLLTGSNASGKSTFLKMTGVNAILAQTVCTAYAASFEMPFAYVYSSMSLTDSIEQGESYYMAELKSLKRILTASAPSEQEDQPAVLCILDEVLRGTNTVERISASAKVLESMAKRRMICMAATHDLELARLLEGEWANYHFDEQLEDGDVAFSYRLKPGPSDTRNAVRLLGSMGFDPAVVSAADEMAARFERTGRWSME